MTSLKQRLLSFFNIYLLNAYVCMPILILSALYEQSLRMPQNVLESVEIEFQVLESHQFGKRTQVLWKRCLCSKLLSHFSSLLADVFKGLQGSCSLHCSMNTRRSPGRWGWGHYKDVASTITLLVKLKFSWLWHGNVPCSKCYRALS